MDEAGATADDDGATAHSQPEPTAPPSFIAEFLSEDPDHRIIEVFQRRGTVDPISFMEVPPRDASAVATAMAPSNPGVVVVVTDPSDPPGLSAVIATDALPDHGLGGPGAGVNPATSITVVDGHTTTMMVANPCQLPTKPSRPDRSHRRRRRRRYRP